MGRVWFAYWLAPYPNQMSIWPNFRSPLLWDVFAVSTYVTVSAAVLVPGHDSRPGHAPRPGHDAGCGSCLWAVRPGLARLGPAVARLRAGLPAAGGAGHAAGAERALGGEHRLRRGRSLPGWHTTIFPPYFVAGAIFSGFAMVVTLMVPARAYFGLKDLVTLRHLDNMNKIILVTGCMVGYAYARRGVHGLVQRQPVRVDSP